MNRFETTAKAVLLVALAAASHSPIAMTDDSGPLQSNPFRRPVFDTTLPIVPPEDDLSAEPELDLRAVLVAGRDSLVNVAGTVVRIGQEHDGYRLILVEEHAAVFSKDGESLRIELHQEEESDEQD